MGQFPRHVVTSVAGLSAQDISRPLKHSFIHTGHGDTDPHRSWGHADRIDRWVMFGLSQHAHIEQNWDASKAHSLPVSLQHHLLFISMSASVTLPGSSPGRFV